MLGGALRFGAHVLRGCRAFPADVLHALGGGVLDVLRGLLGGLPQVVGALLGCGLDLLGRVADGVAVLGLVDQLALLARGEDEVGGQVSSILVRSVKVCNHGPSSQSWQLLPRNESAEDSSGAGSVVRGAEGGGRQ